MVGGFKQDILWKRVQSFGILTCILYSALTNMKFLYSSEVNREISRIHSSEIQLDIQFTTLLNVYHSDIGTPLEQVIRQLEVQ